MSPGIFLIYYDVSRTGVRQSLALGQKLESRDKNVLTLFILSSSNAKTLEPLLNAYFFLQVQHYILVVQAQDSGHPSLSSTLTVYCNVLDLNDNAPIFDPMSYSNEIFENVSVATPVVTVSATDLDSGKSSKPFEITGGFFRRDGNARRGDEPESSSENAINAPCRMIFF